MAPATVNIEGSFADALAQAVSRIPAEYLEARRWFGGKGRGVRAVTLESAHELPAQGQTRLWYCLARIDYADGGSDRYALPLALLPGDHPDEQAVAFKLQGDGASFSGVDALHDEGFPLGLYDLLAGETELQADQGSLRFGRTAVFGEVAVMSNPRENIRVVRSEQSNSSIIYGDAFILKLFRRLENGPNPDLEVLHFLTEETTFRNVPQIAGFIHHAQGDQSTALGALQTFVPNEGDAWQYTLRRLGEYYRGDGDASPLLRDAQELGRVTGGLHVALASGEGQDFTPEVISRADVERWLSGFDHEISETLELLRGTIGSAPGTYRGQLEELLQREEDLRATARLLGELADAGVMKTRYHGDYHLGQVLVAGEDFIILDFEGEPARSLAERRAKHTPLRDVAGMLRSLSYAAAASVLALPESRHANLDERASDWETRARERYLNAYLNEVRASPQRLVPQDTTSFARALRTLELEKAMYELRYELRNRPDWLRVPLRGITRLLES